MLHNLRNRLLNLTGFFSSVGRPLMGALGTPVTGEELILWVVLSKIRGLTKAKGCFVANVGVKCVEEEGARRC